MGFSPWGTLLAAGRTALYARRRYRIANSYAGLCAPGFYPASLGPLLILFRLLNMVDHQPLHRSFRRFQLQAELLKNIFDGWCVFAGVNM